MEVFNPIPSYPDYEISNFGRVRTMARKVRYVHAVTREEHFRQTESRLLKVQFNGRTGYKFHQLYKDKKMSNITIHRLVAETFISKVEGLDYVNHKDGNKHNNVAENLEWCTNEYNHEHANTTGLKASGSRVATAKLNERMVHAIKWLLNKGLTHKELGAAFNISRTSITHINRNKTWKNINQKASN